MSTVFGRIINGQIPCKKVYETKDLIAFEDIHPQAPVHILIVPKKEIPNFQSLEEEDYYLLGEVAKAAQDLAKQYGIEEGYRLLTNNGPGAGQTIFHLHFHLVGGGRLSDELA